MLVKHPQGRLCLVKPHNKATGQVHFLCFTSENAELKRNCLRSHRRTCSLGLTSSL